ncbi:MAG: NAD(P)-dependent oxidoreductase [Desulfuromonadales bacterium]|nr:NAD(P)-dependent oxidoreductase [Desulfuromonadales bacterium]
MMIKEIGFIGLGTVGQHMAANLTKGSFNLTVYDRNPAAVAELVKLGARAAATPFEATKGRDMVIVIVSAPDETQVIFPGADGALAGLDPGTVLVDMGTHSLETTMELADQAAQRRLLFLDAPVWGTKEHAANGLLTILAGGDSSLISRCRETFAFFGLNIIHVGDVGDATKMKFVVNLVQAELMVALSEGLVLGEKLGFKADKILEVLDSGGVASPLFHAKGRSISRGDFSRNLALKYVQDQLLLVQEDASQSGLKLPVADAVVGVFAQAIKDGRGEEDFSAVVKVLRK